MKRILSAALCAVLLSMLCACGAAGAESAEAPKSPLDLLETVWSGYSAGEKFSAIGGDYSEENQRTDAPGVFCLDDAETLDYMLGFPAAEADKIDNAASLVHMMNLNTFTCGAFHVKPGGDPAALCAALRENILARQWMCGIPDNLVIVTVGEYIVSFFGSAELTDTFAARLAAAYPDARTVSEDSIA